MFQWALSDVTIPRSYRMIQGFGVNTFVLVKNGKRTFVKFHWKPHLGRHSLCWDEALKLGGQDPDYLRRDLQIFIEAGIFPKYEFGVQLVPAEDEHKFSFDLLDCTKIIPEEEVPIKWIGTMTLNRTVTDQFAENEQVAFCTNNIVPGIDYSDDPMLQIRNFSYQDTQLIRLGGPNFNQIPINQPVPAACPFLNSIHRDGYNQRYIPNGPHYFPNRFGHPTAAKPEEEGLHFPPYKIEGERVRARGEKFDEVYDQAELFYNSLSDVEKANLISTAHFEIGRCDDRGVQERMVARFNEIDHGLAKAVAANFDIPVGNSTRGKHGKKSDGQNPISMLSKNNNFKCEGRLIAIIAPDGYDADQVLGLQSAFSKLGNIPAIVGLRKGPTYPKGIQQGDSKAQGVVNTQFTFESARSTLFDSVCFVDGDERYQKTLQMGRVKHWAVEAFGHFKAVAAIGQSSSQWISELIPVENKTDSGKNFSVQNGVVIAPSLTKQDSSLFENLTSGPYDGATFASAYAKAIASHRHWTRDVSGLIY